MSIERRTFLTSAAALFAASAAGAQEYKNPALVAAEPGTPLWPPKERFALWPGTPPGAPRPLPAPGWLMYPDGPQLWIKGIASPEVNVFRPALPDGSAILVIPGGSYTFLAVQNEGLHPAERFNAERTTVFVLSYRLPDEGWANRSTVALADAQRATRLIRARAAEFKIDPETAWRSRLFRRRASRGRSGRFARKAGLCSRRRGRTRCPRGRHSLD